MEELVNTTNNVSEKPASVTRFAQKTRKYETDEASISLRHQIQELGESRQ
jgi:hypothetical protein